MSGKIPSSIFLQGTDLFGCEANANFFELCLSETQSLPRIAFVRICLHLSQCYPKLSSSSGSGELFLWLQVSVVGLYGLESSTTHL